MADDQMNQVNEENEVTSTSQTQHPVEPIRAPPAVESEEEEQESEEEMEEEVHTSSHLSTVGYNVVVRQYLQAFGIQTLLFMQFVWVILSRAANVTQTIGLGVVRSLQPQIYIFFQGSAHPYRLQDYTIGAAGVAPVEWYYNADTKVFISSNLYNTSNEYQSHHFQWLSGEIHYNGLTLYDITEFLQQIRWAGASRPSVALVLSAWSLHSGIVLNIREGLFLKAINEDGSESTLNVCV